MKSSDHSGPIGVFDSGYGGLTVLKEIVKELPDYNFIYLGDNARSPYGTRSFDTVYEYTLQAVNKLFEMGCHLVILACNTASAKALRNIQQKDLPKIAPDKRVLGVIRPTTEIIGTLTSTHEIGILATNGTVSSNSYVIEIEKFFPAIKVYQQACPMWVPLIENNEVGNEGFDFFLNKYLNGLLNQSEKIDTIILACTHYPIIEKQIKKVVGDKVKLISQGEIVAKGLKDYLSRHPEIEEKCTKEKKIEFYTSENPETFNEKASLFYGSQIAAKAIHL